MRIKEHVCTLAGVYTLYSDRAVFRRDEMLRTTYRNLYLLKRISDTTSTYRRDKFLNDWAVSDSCCHVTTVDVKRFTFFFIIFVSFLRF